MLLLKLTKNTSLKPKKKKFKKNNGRPPKKNNGENHQAQTQQVQEKDHALFVARVGILLNFADSGNVVLTLRQTLPKNLLWG